MKVTIIKFNKAILLFFCTILFSCNSTETTEILPLPYKIVDQPCSAIITRKYPIVLESKINPEFYELCSSNIEKFDKYTLDSNGIPLSKLGDKYVNYPITISQMATTYYKKYVVTKDSILKRRFLELAKWLKENFTDKGSYGFWLCNADYSGYNLKSPWASAMGQGFGLMAMYEAYALTSDSKFLDVAEKALHGFEISINNGGFSRQLNGETIYEEYPSDVPSQVLNGFIFALCGLNDYYEATQSEKAKELFYKGVNYLENNICRYSLFFTSRYNLYSLNPQLANGIGSGSGDGYHHLHVQQLSWLYIKTGRKVFYDYALNFLEKDLGNYEKSHNILPKISNVEVDNCINCKTHGPNHLNDGVWSYGNFWSSKKQSEVIIEFGEERTEINQLTLFYSNEESANISIEVYKMMPDGNYKFIDSVSNLSVSTHRYQDFFQTGNYKTYINSFSIKSFKAKKVKLKIRNQKDNIYGIRELDFQYDRSEDLKKIIDRLYGH